ncbi:hypothetical protein B5M09_007660 [Aphanomyces astaci]|uniref:EGF-like domain-containing protein n=1 Tax=Aphanomyces astaci TaxID=112090 RepID=A0A3R7ZIC5_APHAT|nr:hypothetical protein B5M09_007660 [Aphanomyces astaci]
MLQGRDVALVQALDTDCEFDTDCPITMACVKIKYRSFSTSQVRGKCALKNVCRGSSSGNCPSYNAPSAPGGELATQCVLVNTTKLRGIKCCGGTWTGGDPSRRLVDNATNTTGFQAADSADCFQCYVDNTNKKVGPPTIYAGQFFCVPKDECLSQSAFPYACSNVNLCTSAPGVLCNNHGTCYPKDIDDPKTSYGCACDTGFDTCQFDCGDGNTKGMCVNDACKCRDGWTGDQCQKCTTDDACNGLCDTVSGTCSCAVNALVEYSLKANVCYQQGTKSVADMSSCASVTCGAAGFCTAGKCFCSSGCVGSACTPCVDTACATCTSSATSFLRGGWLLWTVVLVALTWTSSAVA